MPWVQIPLDPLSFCLYLPITLYRNPYVGACACPLRGRNYDPAQPRNEENPRRDEAAPPRDLRGRPREAPRGSPRAERANQEGNRAGRPRCQGGQIPDPPATQG